MSEDLGIKIGTPEEAFWTSVKDKAIKDTGDLKHQIEINEVIIKYAAEKIAQEVKLKSS